MELEGSLICCDVDEVGWKKALDRGERVDWQKFGRLVMRCLV